METHHILIETPEAAIKQVLVTKGNMPYEEHDIDKFCQYAKSILNEQGIDFDAAEIAQCLVTHFGFTHVPHAHLLTVKIYKQLNPIT